MLCPHCNNEIIGDTAQCPDCGTALPNVDSNKKDAVKKIFTHYKIVLLDPGPRERIFELLAEGAGISVKQARKHKASNTPWNVISRIPFEKAQEIKVLLETSRAIVRLKGMDIWEEEEEVNEYQEKQKPGPYPKRFQKILLLSFFVMLFCALVTAIFFYSINYDPGSQKKLLGNIKVDVPAIPLKNKMYPAIRNQTKR
jgi:hypothetical protein